MGHQKRALLATLFYTATLPAPNFQHPLFPFVSKPAPTRQWHASFPTVGLKMTHKPTYPFIPHFFTLHELAPQKGKGITIAVIDTEGKDKESHAQHSHSLLTDLCPQATIKIIQAFKNGACTKSLLITAVQEAINNHVDILALPLKLDDTIDPHSPASQLLEKELSKIPYVIAAAGNDGNDSKPPMLAYPARFNSVTLSAGAFGYEHECFIPPFSQYEPKRGPTFLLPGVAIRAKENGAAPMTGTSSATMLLTAFVALLLAENQNFFTKHGILTIITNCTVCAHDKEWLTRSLHGVPDMRTALFTLHILKKLNEKIPQQSTKKLLKKIKSIRKILIKPIKKFNLTDMTDMVIKFRHDTQSIQHPLCIKFSSMTTTDAQNYTLQFVRRRGGRPRTTGSGARGRSTTNTLQLNKR
jgi:hypothetical protein